MYKDRQTLGGAKTEERIECRKYSFEQLKGGSYSSGKGKEADESQKSSSTKTGSFGPVFKDREHFNSMHFF